jgi:hypothetical protein
MPAANRRVNHRLPWAGMISAARGNPLPIWSASDNPQQFQKTKIIQWFLGFRDYGELSLTITTLMMVAKVVEWSRDDVETS